LAIPDSQRDFTQTRPMLEGASMKLSGQSSAQVANSNF